MTHTDKLTAEQQAALGQLILNFAREGIERFGSVEEFQAALETLNRGGQ